MRRTLPIIPLILIILTVLLGIVIGPVSSAIEMPSALKPYTLPLLLLLACVECHRCMAVFLAKQVWGRD